MGRFFAIHDASHTRGHALLYDPENKLLPVDRLCELADEGRCSAMRWVSAWAG